MKDTVGAHMVAAFGYRSLEAFAASVLSDPAPRGRSPLTAAERERWERKHAAREGKALGHAFRAAELAYDLGRSSR